MVRWLGAVQAQDYLGSLWALGLRLPGTTQLQVEQALADGAIIRTWPLRGTIHFVAPQDVRWMLELVTPRLLATLGRRLERESGLDPIVLKRSRNAFTRGLRGGKQLARPVMYQLLEAAGVSTAGQRGYHILWRLAQEGLICFGPRAGKQPTFVLLDEWVPPSKKLERDAALAELAGRYFTSHGPATVPDFAWWSGLTAADATAGLEAVKRDLTRETIDGRVYWMPPGTERPRVTGTTAHLLPAYDEYTVAYRDRRAVLTAVPAARPLARNGILSPVIVIDGQVVGTWRRSLSKQNVVIALAPFARLKPGAKPALVRSANRYGGFLQVPAILK